VTPNAESSHLRFRTNDIFGPNFRTITIDGDFGDWDPSYIVVNDTGDMPGNSSQYDLCEVYIANDMSYLYLAMFMRGKGSFGLWAYLDVDRSATTGFNINDIGAEYLIANGFYDGLLSWDSQNNDWNRVPTVGYSSYLSFTGSGREWSESRIDLNSIGSPLLIDLVFVVVDETFRCNDVAPNVGHVTYAISGFHNIAVTNVSASKNVVGQGYSLNFNLTVANQGSYAEAFNVTVYANATIIETKEVALASKNSAVITFTWNITGFAKGNCTIWAYAWPVTNEMYTADNTFNGSTVFVTVAGDVTGDGICDIQDISIMVDKFLTQPPNPLYDPNCDANGDGIIDVADISIAVDNFLKDP
jgi:hypothetical protein